MDKATNYRSIARQLIMELWQGDPEQMGNLRTHLITDDEHGHYLYYTTGHQNKRWVYGATVHIEVRQNGEVWLHHDGTDLVIADMLEERGVATEDLIIGWLTPRERALAAES